MIRKRRSDWQAPSQWDKKLTCQIIISFFVIVGVFTAGFYSHRPPVEIKEVQLALSPHTPDLAEQATIRNVLDQFARTAHIFTGKIIYSGMNFTTSWHIFVTTGYGTLTLPVGETARILLNKGEVYINGNQNFWRTMGIAAPLHSLGWVQAAPGFLNNTLFYPISTIKARLIPVSTTRVLGDQLNQSDNISATLSPISITHLVTDDMTMDIIPTSVGDIKKHAHPILPAHPRVLMTVAEGQWLLRGKNL